ncbi:MAG: response regulator transcription factor [Acidobacteriaceae bacterium]|nr:response regulator transcription factor [Acidobacteriaceae bacterium]
MTILLAEDEPNMARFIARGLADEDYTVDVAATGDDAFSRALTNPYDLLILDRKLPGKDGLAVCRELRAESVRIPVLMLTALGNAGDVIAGLNCGADDYLVKPFEFAVLLARVRALMRRPRELRADILEIADLSVNTIDRTVTRGGRPIRLTAKEYALLELLMIHKGEILGRAQIAEHAWDEALDPLSNVIDVYMNRLRKKIDGPFERRLIHTRRSEGYMLAADEQASHC